VQLTRLRTLRKASIFGLLKEDACVDLVCKLCSALLHRNCVERALDVFHRAYSKMLYHRKSNHMLMLSLGVSLCMRAQDWHTAFELLREMAHRDDHPALLWTTINHLMTQAVLVRPLPPTTATHSARSSSSTGSGGRSSSGSSGVSGCTSSSASGTNAGTASRRHGEFDQELGARTPDEQALAHAHVLEERGRELLKVYSSFVSKVAENFPENMAAHFLHSNMCFWNGSFAAALRGYRQAFELGGEENRYLSLMIGRLLRLRLRLNSGLGVALGCCLFLCFCWMVAVVCVSVVYAA
jgi:hypothetical protein